MKLITKIVFVISQQGDVAIRSAAAMANHNSIVFMFWWRKAAKTEGRGGGTFFRYLSLIVVIT